RKKWIFPAATSALNSASEGEGSVPLKPPIAITGSPVASWTPAALFAPTVAATQRYEEAFLCRSVTRDLLGVEASSRPPRRPAVPPGTPPVPPAGKPPGANPPVGPCRAAP